MVYIKLRKTVLSQQNTPQKVTRTIASGGNEEIVYGKENVAFNAIKIFFSTGEKEKGASVVVSFSRD